MPAQDPRVAEKGAADCPFDASSGPASFAIRVRHAQRHWYLSWLLDPEHAALNPDPVAAMRFGSAEAAERLIENTPVLRDAAQRGDAVAVPIFRPYRGVPLLDCRHEARCSTRAERRR